MTPLNRGGGHNIENLQLLCPGCNRRKSDRTDEEFRGRYSNLLPPRRLAKPARFIKQSEFKALTKTTTDPQTYTMFKSGKYYTAGKKVAIGSLVTGIVVLVLPFWLLSEYVSPDYATNLGTTCAVVGLLSGLGVRIRAWYTGKDKDS
ncbi:MAG: HNH endonuclease signature motif containing protein [Chloroflexota bacterium]|nr:HNH endonuclease signature motif containing protein [Chloroflexota bacterium]